MSFYVRNGAVLLTFHGEVERTELVLCQGVGTALKNDCVGPVVIHDVLNDGSEDGGVGLVVNAVSERDIDSVTLAFADASVDQVASSRKEVSEFVKRAGHDAVCGVESLFNAISVVDVDVNVEHSGMVAQQLKNGEVDVVHVAESRAFALFGVMQAASPIDADVGLACVELSRAAWTTTRYECYILEHGIGLQSDPPAEMRQNSKRPSKGGQSSPTKSVQCWMSLGNL